MEYSSSYKRLAVLLSLLLFFYLPTAFADPRSSELERVEIIATTPSPATGLPENMVAKHIQMLDSEDIEESQSLAITDVLSSKFSGVTTNAAQNNPLQPDVQFRGYTASPLLGLPIGVAVYQNGVRLNEPLGDTVNWDVISTDAIAGVQFISGANPLYGLNALGGALTIQMKNGFTHPGHSFKINHGSFDRDIISLQSGASNDNYSYYVNFKRFEEDGWRDLSPSDANNYFANFAFKNESSQLDFSIQHADTDLTGNGAVPIELAEQEYDAIFTAPDVTENEMTMFSVDGSHWLDEKLQLTGNAYVRKTETDAFNGDLAEDDDEDDDDANDDDDDEFNAVNNISVNDQDSQGFSSQATWFNALRGKNNQLTLGIAFNQGKADFTSKVQQASLDPDTRSTLTEGAQTGDFTDDETDVSTRTRNYSLYVTDTISLSDKLALTGSARYDKTKIRLRDKTGEQAELDGDHTFNRINPSLGLTYQYTPEVNAYASYSESSRAPTPIELSCSEEVLTNTDHQECRLPNAFLADPPLDDVIAKNFEFGLRGSYYKLWNWHLGLFHTDNQDDIIFQSTGRSTGLFKNVDKTRRQGAEMSLAFEKKSYQFTASYNYLKATFEDSFSILSPNHTNADAEGEVRVNSGDSIPGLPEHTIKFSGGYRHANYLIGAEWHISSGQYMRGDESNEMGKVSGYDVVNLHAHYQPHPMWQLTLRLNNVFDKEYYTFGIIGEEPDEAPGLDDFEDARFYGPGAERGVWLGLRTKFE